MGKRRTGAKGTVKHSTADRMVPSSHSRPWTLHQVRSTVEVSAVGAAPRPGS